MWEVIFVGLETPVCPERPAETGHVLVMFLHPFPPRLAHIDPKY